MVIISGTTPKTCFLAANSGSGRRTPAANLSAVDRQRILGGIHMRQDGHGVHKLELDVETFVEHDLAQLVEGKRVLVAPAYGMNTFTLKLMGAREVVGIEMDLNTLSWVKGIQEYYHYNGLGPRLMELAEECQLRPHMLLGYSKEQIHALTDKTLQQALREEALPRSMEGITFVEGCLGTTGANSRWLSMAFARVKFDYIFVPYLLGIRNGIEKPDAIARAFDDIWSLANEKAKVAVHPLWGDKGLSSGQSVIDDLYALVPRHRFHVLETDLDPHIIAPGLLEVIK